MRRARAAGIFGAAVATVALAAWVLPGLTAREETAIGLRLADEEGRAIERAVVEFETETGRIVSVQELAAGRWVPAPPPPAEEGWGRRVARVRVRAFGCDRQAPVDVERRIRGARFGQLAPHPVPLTHVYQVRGEVRCPWPPDDPETGLGLQRLVRDLSAGEPWSFAAAQELIRIGPQAAPALPEIIEFVEATEIDSLRLFLVRAIGAMGAAGRPAAQALFPLLDEPNDGFRRAVASALERLGSETPGAVEELAAAARSDPDPHVQQHILRILGRMGPAARAAQSDLVAILESDGEEEGVRLSAFWALGKLDTPEGDEARRRYAADHAILY